MNGWETRSLNSFSKMVKIQRLVRKGDRVERIAYGAMWE
jgi:hypothetical protein